MYENIWKLGRNVWTLILATMKSWRALNVNHRESWCRADPCWTSNLGFWSANSSPQGSPRFQMLDPGWGNSRRFLARLLMAVAAMFHRVEYWRWRSNPDEMTNPFPLTLNTPWFPQSTHHSSQDVKSFAIRPDRCSTIIHRISWLYLHYIPTTFLIG